MKNSPILSYTSDKGNRTIAIDGYSPDHKRDLNVNELGYDVIKDLEYRFDGDNAIITGCSRFSNDKDVTIPSEIDGHTVTEISARAFRDCTSLESVTIPDSVETIGEYAFSDCTSLKSVTIPDSVTDIGEGVFAGCTSLESVSISDSVIVIPRFTFADCMNLESVTIPDSVETIDEYAFMNCTSIERITIPVGVTVDFSAFEDCVSLKNVTFRIFGILKFRVKVPPIWK